MFFDVEKIENVLLKLEWNVTHTNKIESVKNATEQKNKKYFGDIANHKIISTIGNINIIKPIGNGGHTEVFLGYDTVNNKFVAIRNINKKNIENLKIIQEYDPDDLFGCSKPLGFIKNKFMIMNVHGPNLEKRITEHGPLKEIDALLFCLRAAHTLYWLENVCEFSHGDISPCNFVFNSISDYPHNIANIRLIDFDSLQHPEFISTKQFGTHMYASPENNKGVPYQYRANDAYGLGKTIYYCVTGEKNYTNRTRHMYSPTIGKILDWLLCYNPDKRATYDKIIRHVLYALRFLTG